MFARILIANRGEIALRVMATCRRLGVETVAIFAPEDRDALHVAHADHAVCIEGARPVDSYLNGPAIIAAARDAGAQAMHPGYGFLSENPDFVQAVTEAGLAFIGPSSAAIRAMGLKDAAKALMEKAGVPVVPGYHGADQSLARLEAEARRVGYPVMIKAVAGGGGKGMRVVDAPDGFAEALRAARSEAKAAFGNADVLVEKCIRQPRHIEVQVFGDGDEAVHLFERDCSLQRRHQKVIEEAPAPGMTDELRAAMGAAAVRAARAIGYAGAGTVEFIVDGANGLRPDGFWFMEMNTRLQVEHPVTEAITGVDLVEWQLRVAAGEPLPARQQDLAITGHAIEARLYAEDAAAGFLPATGRLSHLRFPRDARVDTAVARGCVIGPHFDPMFAKVICHGADRETALRRLNRALEETEVAGCTTNLGFLRRLLADRDVALGHVDTGLIARRGAALTDDPVPPDEIWALAALADQPLDAPLAGFTLWSRLFQAVRLVWKGTQRTVRVAVQGQGRFAVELDDARHEIAHRGGRWWINGTPRQASVLETPGAVSVFLQGGFHFTRPDPLAAGTDGPSGDVIEAPMPGQVVAVQAGAGDRVKKGDCLVVLSAMKMEHALRAGRDGTVGKVMVTAGQQVDAGVALIRLEAEAEV